MTCIAPLILVAGALALYAASLLFGPLPTLFYVANGILLILLAAAVISAELNP